MKDIFISHVEEDSRLALAMAELLEDSGVTTWCYERDCLPGISYLLQTGQAIEECRAFLLIVSLQALDSHQITKEVVRAHESDKPIIPLLVGVSHTQFQKCQPEWREAVGAAASMPVPEGEVFESVPRILEGLKVLGIAANLTASRREATTPAVARVQQATVTASGTVPVRVVFSCLLRIDEGGRFLLVRNLHRPESFAPFGGVYKYFPNARADLDSLEFQPQVDRDEMLWDLRGFVPSSAVDGIRSWFELGHCREDAIACLWREVEEECDEVGLRLPFAVSDLVFRQVRTVHEGPEQVPGQDYRQFRVFDVYDLVWNECGLALIAELNSVGSHSDGLLRVNAQEIRKGRSNSGQIVAATTAYLLGTQRIHRHDPMW